MEKQVLITWEYGNSSSSKDSILKATYKLTAVKNFCEMIFGELLFKTFKIFPVKTN